MKVSWYTEDRSTQLLPIKMRVVPILIYLFGAERFKISNVRMINFVREVGAENFCFVFHVRF
jgi:hypothetical protein